VVEDNGPIHTSKRSLAALAARAHWLTVEWPPKYAPELNEIGVGPSGRTGTDLTFDRQAGLSKDESSWSSTGPIASSLNVRSLRSFWPVRRSMVWRSATISRNLIRVWVERYQAGAFDEDAAAADLLQQYEARIAALERLVGKQALELEFLKEGLRNAPPARSGSTSAIAGPKASQLPKDAG
jgi:transposase